VGRAGAAPGHGWISRPRGAGAPAGQVVPSGASALPLRPAAPPPPTYGAHLALRRHPRPRQFGGERARVAAGRQQQRRGHVDAPAAAGGVLGDGGVGACGGRAAQRTALKGAVEQATRTPGQTRAATPGHQPRSNAWAPRLTCQHRPVKREQLDGAVHARRRERGAPVPTEIRGRLSNEIENVPSAGRLAAGEGPGLRGGRGERGRPAGVRRVGVAVAAATRPSAACSSSAATPLRPLHPRSRSENAPPGWGPGRGRRPWPPRRAPQRARW
jgi:hypothetical protein